MELMPPFEVQVASAGTPTRGYCLDCMPNLIGDGRFKPHLVIRTADTHEIVAYMNLASGPFHAAQQAAEVAYDAGEGWVRMFG